MGVGSGVGVSEGSRVGAGLVVSEGLGAGVSVAVGVGVSLGVGSVVGSEVGVSAGGFDNVAFESLVVHWSGSLSVLWLLLPVGGVHH